MREIKKILFVCFVFYIVSILNALEYTVVKGDCLWFIADRYYRNPFLWKKIYEANKDKINNPDLIYPMQVFEIPDVVLNKQVVQNTTGDISYKQEESTDTTGNFSEIGATETSTMLQEIKTAEPSIDAQTLSELEKSESEEEMLADKADFIKKSKLVEPKEMISEPGEIEKVEGEEETIIIEDKIRRKEKFFLGEEEIDATIVSGKESKIMYTDGDVVYCKPSKNLQLLKGQIMYIYHIGPSIYDSALDKVKYNQAKLVGKLKVLEVKDGDFTGIIMRVNTPVMVNDVLLK